MNTVITVGLIALIGGSIGLSRSRVAGLLVLAASLLLLAMDEVTSALLLAAVWSVCFLSAPLLLGSFMVVWRTLFPPRNMFKDKQGNVVMDLTYNPKTNSWEYMEPWYDRLIGVFWTCFYKLPGHVLLIRLSFWLRESIRRRIRSWQAKHAKPVPQPILIIDTTRFVRRSTEA